MTRTRDLLAVLLAAALGIAGALLLIEWAADDPPTPTHEEMRT